MSAPTVAVTPAPGPGLANAEYVAHWALYVKEVEVKGRAVFAGKVIPEGSLVIKFEGPIYDKETCPEFSEAIQVGVNAWMWSSGGLDDLVNHSCNPCCGLWQVNGDTYLLALREIAVGEELSFDYSTSMVDEPWGMECGCGDAKCRGHIGNFLEMSEEVMQYYAGKGTLPEHVWVTAEARGVKLNRGGPAHSPTASSATSTPENNAA
jgi:hypothetical protein